MTFIKKHFILTLLTIFLIFLSGCFLLSPFFLTTVTTSVMSYKVPEDIADRITSFETGVTYELSDLKTDANTTYPSQLPLIPVGYGGSGSIVAPETSLYLIHEGKLTRGSKITLEFAVNQTESGTYHYFLINENGIIDSYDTDTTTPYHINFKIKKTGNYAIILYVEEALGDYQLNYNITKSLLPL